MVALLHNKTACYLFSLAVKFQDLIIIYYEYRVTIIWVCITDEKGNNRSSANCIPLM